MKRYNKIVEKEIIRIQPYHLLGVILHSLVIYISFKIPQIIGNILNLLMEETINQEQIIEQAYWLIFYCVIVYIPRTLYRTLYFTTSRKSDTYLRKEVIKNLQKVKPEYFEKENKGVFLAYLTKEIPMIKKFLGEFFQNAVSIIMTPILVILITNKGLNVNLSLMLVAIMAITLIIVLKLYQKKKLVVEDARKEYVNTSNVIEQNTSNFTLVKLYNNQKEQKELFDKENKIMKQKDYNVGKIDNMINNTTNIAEGLSYILTVIYGVIFIKNVFDSKKKSYFVFFKCPSNVTHNTFYMDRHIS